MCAVLCAGVWCASVWCASVRFAGVISYTDGLSQVVPIANGMKMNNPRKCTVDE